MFDSYSVRAVISAKEDSSFKSTFANAQKSVNSLTDTIKSGFGMGIGMKIADTGIGLVQKGIGVLSSSLGDAITRYDTLKNFPEVMKKIGFTAEDAAKSKDKLIDGIDGLPTTLDGIVSNVQSVAMVTRDLDKSTDLVLALNNAFLGSGSSSEAAERGMQQFVQALSKGKFQGDEWNTLMETMGPAIYKVAEYMGFNGTNAANDLKEALGDGTVTIDDFTQAFIELNGEVEVGGKKFEGFEQMARSSTGGIKTSITNLKTTVVKNLANMLDELDQKMGENGTSISGHLDNIKKIVNDTFKKIISSPQFGRLAEAFENAFSYIEKILPSVIDGALELLGYMVDKGFEVAHAFADAGREIKDTAEKTGTANIVMESLKGIIDGVASVFKFAAEMLEKFKNPIVWVIQHIPEIIKLIIGIKTAEIVINKVVTFAGFIRNIYNTVKSVKDGVSKIISAVSGVASKISSCFNKGFSDTGTTFTGFQSIVKSVFGNVQQYASKAGDSVYKISGSFTNVSGVAESSVYNISSKLSGVSSSASTVGGNVSSSIGGGFKSAASSASSASGSMMSSIGGIAGALGAAVGIVATLVTAIMKWKEEQYKAGQAMHEMTDEQKQFIDSCAETAKAYENIQNAARDSYAERESEIQYTELLLGKYEELLDENGKVIEGKEKLAETLMGQVCESLGMERSEIENLRGEYQNLIDDNGRVKQGYEDRADEILTTLAQAWGLEKSEIAEIIGHNKDLKSTIEDVTNAKRENAKVEAITEAEKQAVKDQIQLQSEQRQLTQLQKEAQQEYDAFLTEHGDHLNKLTDEQRGEYDKLRENLNKYDTSLHENQIALQETENVHRICGDALVANAEGNTEVMEQCWWRLTEGIKDHTNGSREELRQQVFDAQEYLRQKKEAYEINATETTKAEMEEAEKRLEYMSAEYEKLLGNQDGYLTQRLQSERDAAQKELDDAQAKLDELNRRNSRYNENRFKEDDTAAKNLVAQKKKALDDIERDLEASLITQKSLGDQYNSTTERNLSTSLQNQKDIYSNFHTQIDGQVDSHGKTLLSKTTTTGNDVNNATRTALNNVEGTIRGEKGNLSTASGVAAGGVTGAFSVLGNLQSIASQRFNDMIGTIGNKADSAKAKSDTVASGIINTVSRLLPIGATNMYGQNVVNGLINGLNARRSYVVNTAYSIASAVTSTIAGALRIGSPSKLTTQYGEWTGEGLVIGMSGKIKDAAKAGRNLAIATTSSLSKTLNKTSDNILLFPGIDDIGAELDAIERFRSPDIHAVGELNHNIVVENHLEINSREFAQATARDNSRALNENKRRRRA